MLHYSTAIKLQEKLACKVVTKDRIRKINRVCAVDVSYKDQHANAAAVVMDAKTLQLLDYAMSRTNVKVPYIPGLLMLRESGPALSALKLLKEDFDVLLVDGNGQLHPRKCGLACYLGIKLTKPTIGIAKSLLCGRIAGNDIKLDGKILGKIIENKKGKKIFVSVGHNISLKTASTLVESLIREGKWLPEPMLLADRYSKGRVS
jgi:deoxyribonuclease V